MQVQASTEELLRALQPFRNIGMYDEYGACCRVEPAHLTGAELTQLPGICLSLGCPQLLEEEPPDTATAALMASLSHLLCLIALTTLEIMGFKLTKGEAEVLSGALRQLPALQVCHEISTYVACGLHVF